MRIYFAYGSNMSPERLQARVPSARPLAAARLAGHVLRWHKFGRGDNSGKCDGYHTGDPGHVLHGLVYQIRADEQPDLDAAEGLGQGYEIKDVEVELEDGRVMTAFTYYATDIAAALSPLCWYKEHVVRGARYAGLPQHYVAELEAVVEVADPSPTRRKRELAIYGDTVRVESIRDDSDPGAY